MSSFYSIPIPEPIYAAIEQLAQIQYGNEVISAYWYSETRQVVLRLDDDWFIQPNGSVTRSLAALLHCTPYQVVASDLFFFETPGHGVSVDNRLSLAFYSCEWSDYACDKIAIQFTLKIEPALQSAAHRMSYVIADLYAAENNTYDYTNNSDMTMLIPEDDDDIYADMPALIPLNMPIAAHRYMTRSRTTRIQ